MSDVKYSQIKKQIAELLAETASEEQTARERHKRLDSKAANAAEVLDKITGLEFDALTLADVGTIRDALLGQAGSAKAAARAARDLNDQAKKAGEGIEKEHGGINDAVGSAPVKAAKAAAYSSRL